MFILQVITETEKNMFTASQWVSGARIAFRSYRCFILQFSVIINKRNQELYHGIVLKLCTYLL